MNKLLKKLKGKIFSISVSTFITIVIIFICFLIYAWINDYQLFEKLFSGEAFFIYIIILIVALLVGTEIWKRKILGDENNND